MPLNMYRFTVLILLLLVVSTPGYSQNTSPQFIAFPASLQSQWRYSLGLTFTTTPHEITEETHISIPAIDFQILKSAGSNFTFDAHLLSQILQNHASVGFRWLHPLSDKFSLSAGDEMAGWMGWIQIETMNTRAYGILNYPNVSIGYKFDEKLLLSLKAELLLNFHQQFFVGKQEVEKNPEAYSGEAFTIALEQPFFNGTWVTLKFKAMYSNFFWQAWSLFENYDRNLFYPQVTAAFIL